MQATEFPAVSARGVGGDRRAQYRTVVMLREVQVGRAGRSSDSLGVPEATVRVHLHRGQQRLRGILREVYGHEWDFAVLMRFWISPSNFAFLSTSELTADEEIRLRAHLESGCRFRAAPRWRWRRSQRRLRSLAPARQKSRCAIRTSCSTGERGPRLSDRRHARVHGRRHDLPGADPGSADWDSSGDRRASGCRPRYRRGRAMPWPTSPR